MLVDILVALLVLSAAVLGWIRGTVSALSRLFVVLFALVLAWLIGPELAVFYQGKTDTEAATAIAVSFIIVYAVFWGLIAYGAGRAVKTLTDSERKLRVPDRLGGFALGLLKGALVAYFVVALLLTKFIGSGSPDLDYGSSHASAFVMGNNLLLYKVEALEAFIETREEAQEDKDAEAPPWQHGVER